MHRLGYIEDRINNVPINCNMELVKGALEHIGCKICFPVSKYRLCTHVRPIYLLTRFFCVCKCQNMYSMFVEVCENILDRICH